VSVDYLLGHSNASEDKKPSSSVNTAELEGLGELLMAFHRGGIEEVTAEEARKILEIYKIIKTNNEDKKKS
jgi:hypothetical protein